MAALNNPSEIAREALRQLATRRTPPTPDNYRALYFQIAGQQDTAHDEFPEKAVRALIAALPNTNAEQRRLAKQLERASQQKHWPSLQQALVEFVASRETGDNWKELIPSLLRQWETRHAGLTPVRKRELLEHVLAGSESPGTLLTRLNGLVRTWSQTPVASTADLVGAEPPAIQAGNTAEISEAFHALRELFSTTLETTVLTLTGDDEGLSKEAGALAARIREAEGIEALRAITIDLKRFAFRVENLCDDRNETHAGVLHLLQLLIENISDLAIDDHWLHGQIDVVKELVATPMNPRVVDDAERRLKEVIYKQAALKQSLNEAKDALKTMLAGFVERLADFAEATSDYHDRIEACAEKISKADDIRDLESVIQDVMQQTRVIQLNAQRSRDDLREARRRVEAAETRIRELQDELGKASELVRHDQLTGILNRRGMEETLDKEIARAKRRQTALCLGVLDIDDFKKLNDSLGHQAGDAALVHLTNVIRGTLRPQDTVARYGGEEFVIILPETTLEDARQALVRLQRELTKKFFLHENKKLLITFSAGVTQLPAEETAQQAIKRADELMYKAKQSGKNKVIAA